MTAAAPARTMLQAVGDDPIGLGHPVGASGPHGPAGHRACGPFFRARIGEAVYSNRRWRVAGGCWNCPAPNALPTPKPEPATARPVAPVALTAPPGPGALGPMPTPPTRQRGKQCGCGRVTTLAARTWARAALCPITIRPERSDANKCRKNFYPT
jgi:hypothetical protein